MTTRTAIIREQHMHLYQTGKERFCLSCPYADCVEFDDDRARDCPIKIARAAGISLDDMLPLVTAGRYHADKYGHYYSADNLRRMAEIVRQRKQLQPIGATPQ